MPGQRVTPAAFATAAPPERITGFEAEDDVRRARTGELDWADYDQLLDRSTFSRAGIIATILPFSKIPQDNEAWLANGGRIYIDRDPRDSDRRDLRNFEYCTPEVLGPRRAVTALRASRVILHSLAQATNNDDLRIFRRGAYVSPAGETVTSGLQTSFITPNHIATPRTNIAVLETHWATALYAWAGMVGANGYLLSQKAQGIGNRILFQKHNSQVATDGQKPFGLILYSPTDADINGNSPEYARVEDRTKEESTDWGTFMGAATTSVLLRVLEHPQYKDLNRRLKKLILTDPVDTFQATAGDLSLQYVYETASGHKRAIDIQAELADIALALSTRITLPPDEQWAVEEWVTICRDLQTVARTEDITLVADRIGWAARLYCLKEAGYDESTTAADEHAVNFCLSWDRVSAPGARQIFERRHGVVIATNDEVAKAVRTPAPGTRAQIRARHIKDRRYIIQKIGWNSVSGLKLDAADDATDMHCQLKPYATSHTCTPGIVPA